MRRTERAAAALLVSLGLGAAAMPAGAQTLRLAVAAPATSFDPHYHTLTPNAALADHVFESLIDRTPDSRPVPGLAESWKAIDDLTWELKLRRGVTWHNGEPFTAEDVVNTLARVPKVANSPGSYAIYTRSITRVEVVDPHTVRLHTDKVHPLLPTDLTQVAVIWRGLGDEVSTSDFNGGKAAMGTGPYRLERYDHGTRAMFVRNDAYWGGRPTWERVDYRMIPSNGARVAALRAGDVDMIDSVPTQDVAGLEKESGLHISRANSLRSILMRYDMREQTPYVTGPNGEKLEKNPFLDRRVREALSIAINRKGIADRVMSGAANPTGQMMPEGTFGYAPDVAPPPYDPARAKRLLAEAGFPDGLQITLLAPNNRYVNDSIIAQTIGQMWARIGVKPVVDTMPSSVFFSRTAQQDNSIALSGWANSVGEPSAGMRGQFATRDRSKGWGSVNHTLYSNKEFDALLTRALETVDDEKREALFQQMSKLIAEDFAYIPLHHQVNLWALRDTLQHTPRADEMTRAMDVKPRG
ncbi:ABC transporter substrate-binding protein [Teichococcus aestuarii]|uniref:ABC transporter substrate-binding protein n=1 Tax=Teichococcus aestuarii TaxID=568898 RepID=A0A2U1V2K4_9PROT|nr:ABC transporter substrate-binding protein [Pseudoroseomonas aestuarii]PWC28126.1 ABC transporter substrate-binding protein [Pseudoroseomonas aestuarii]